MSPLLTQIAGIAALVPALQFGQLPKVVDVSGATKEAFQATSDALDTIGTKKSKGKSSSRGKRGSTANNASENQSKSPSTMFSKMGERANTSSAESSAALRATAEEREKSILRVLGYSTDMFYRGALSIIGVVFAGCIAVRIKEKVKDYTTGRPSLSKSKIVRR